MNIDKEKLKEIISSIITIPKEDISDTTNLIGDLFIDSLTLIHIVSEIEKEFDIEFSADMFNLVDGLDLNMLYDQVIKIKKEKCDNE